MQTWKSFDLSQGSDDCRLRGFVRINLSEKCRQPRHICQGCPDLEMNITNESFLKTYTYIDKIGVLRNNRCSLLLPEDAANQNLKRNRQCKICKTIKHVLNKKIIRRQHNKNYVQIKKLSPKKREQFLKLRQQVRNTGRSKRRAQIAVRLLKETVTEHQKQINGMSQMTVDTILAENKNISANEQLAIREIFKAAKVKDPKGRRYSDDWIILCVLLHMRSPVTYRMIHDNKILPVPSVRTIRR